MKPPSTNNTASNFALLAAAIATLMFIFSTENYLPSRIAISILTGLFASPIIFGVLVVGDNARQITSNTLSVIGVLGVAIVPMMPEITFGGWLIMLVVSPILLYLGHRLDTTGRKTGDHNGTDTKPTSTNAQRRSELA